MCSKVEDFLKFDSNRMYRNLFNCWIFIDKSRVLSCHLRYEIETRSKEEGIGIDLIDILRNIYTSILSLSLEIDQCDDESTYFWKTLSKEKS